VAVKKAEGKPAPSSGPVLDFMRGFYDLSERQLEALFQDPRRPAHERLAAIAAYLYRQPDDAGLPLFYPALEGIEAVAFGLRQPRAAEEPGRGHPRRASSRRSGIAHAA
jgi:hypothetical protein